MRAAQLAILAAVFAAPALGAPDRRWKPDTDQPVPTSVIDITLAGPGGPGEWHPKTTSDCDETTTKTKHWAPPPPPTSTPCEESESTHYTKTTTTATITSCPGPAGCAGPTTHSSTVYPPTTAAPGPPAPPASSAPALSLTLGVPGTTHSAPAAPTLLPSSSIVTHVNSTSGVVTKPSPSLTLPASGAVMGNSLSITAALVGVVGVVFAML